MNTMKCDRPPRTPAAEHGLQTVHDATRASPELCSHHSGRQRQGSAVKIGSHAVLGRVLLGPLQPWQAVAAF